MYSDKQNNRAIRRIPIPTVQKVSDYTKNISQSIFTPGCSVKDFRSSVDVEKLKNATVRMCTYRASD